MGCMSLGLKILTSRICELADVSELDLDLAERDTDFMVIANKFLQNLTRFKDILPQPQGLCMDGQDVIGVCSTCD